LWDQITILSLDHEHHEQADKIGILSHEEKDGAGAKNLREFCRRNHSKPVLSILHTRRTPPMGSNSILGLTSPAEDSPPLQGLGICPEVSGQNRWTLMIP
jgi:hypothetical protein